MDIMSARNMIEKLFPHLKPFEYEVRSEKDYKYNCFAFTLNDTKHNWDPNPYADKYWPEGMAREPALEAVIAMYQSFGYVRCSNWDIEPGFQKIALYVKEGQPRHAAKQLPSGRWVSKLGYHVDFEHPLEPLNGGFYGDIQYILKRPVQINMKD